MTRYAEVALSVLVFIAILIVVGCYAIAQRRACDEAGGVLVRGAVAPFACVARP